MSTPPRIEPTLHPVPGAPPPVIDPLLRPPPRRGQSPWEPPRPSFAGHIALALLTLLGLLLLLIALLRWLPPPTTAYMLQSPTKPVQYQWVPASQIAEPMRHAVIAAEDQKFWLHHGFDYEAIQKAEAYNRDNSHRRRGASTISQQTAKNLFLWPGGWVRKGIEAGLTVLIEQLWGKPRILEMYLNVAEFGPGIYGVGAAAKAYFGKPASQLTPDEAARLAAVLPNPRHWSARDPGAYVQSRATWILGQMGYGGIGAPREEPLAPASELQGADEDEALQSAPDAPAPAPDAAPAPAPGDAPAAIPDTPPPAAPPAPQDGAQTPPVNPDTAPASPTAPDTAAPASAPPPPGNPPASAPPPAAPQ